MPGKPWPHDTHEKLVLAGYKHAATTPCKGPNCKTQVLWYLTPKGHYMPFEKDSDGKMRPHHASCKDVGHFRDPAAPK